MTGRLRRFERLDRTRALGKEIAKDAAEGAAEGRTGWLIPS